VLPTSSQRAAVTHQPIWRWWATTADRASPAIAVWYLLAPSPAILRRRDLGYHRTAGARAESGGPDVLTPLVSSASGLRLHNVVQFGRIPQSKRFCTQPWIGSDRNRGVVVCGWRFLRWPVSFCFRSATCTLASSAAVRPHGAAAEIGDAPAEVAPSSPQKERGWSCGRFLRHLRKYQSGQHSCPADPGDHSNTQLSLRDFALVVGVQWTGPHLTTFHLAPAVLPPPDMPA